MSGKEAQLTHLFFSSGRGRGQKEGCAREILRGHDLQCWLSSLLGGVFGLGAQPRDTADCAGDPVVKAFLL